MYDPIGPGTPAWNAHDKAIDAWQAYKHGGHKSTSKEGKRYNNARHHMIECLRAANTDEATIKGWCNLLDEMKDQPRDQ